MNQLIDIAKKSNQYTAKNRGWFAVGEQEGNYVEKKQSFPLKWQVVRFSENYWPPVLQTSSENEIATFRQAIQEQVEELQSLEVDWDDSGALAPIPGNIDNAVNFLWAAFYDLQKSEIFLCIPEVNACPDGSVDVVWRRNKAFMLINFRNPEEQIAFYYFDEYNDKLGRQGGIQINEQIPADIQLYLKAISE